MKKNTLTIILASLIVCCIGVLVVTFTNKGRIKAGVVRNAAEMNDLSKSTSEVRNASDPDISSEDILESKRVELELDFQNEQKQSGSKDIEIDGKVIARSSTGVVDESVIEEYFIESASNDSTVEVLIPTASKKFVSSKKGNKEVTSKNTEASTEESRESITEESKENTTEESKENTTEESKENTTEESKENTTEESKESTIEESKERITEEPTEESSQEVLDTDDVDLKETIKTYEQFANLSASDKMVLIHSFSSLETYNDWLTDLIQKRNAGYTENVGKSNENIDTASN